MLESADATQRIWIEFEISRADPVANHAKYATARFFETGAVNDAFVSMASRHIVPGRAALAAGAAMMMRAMGIPAFQVDLLPGLDGESIRRLNALPLAALDGHPIDVANEIDRAMQVARPTVVEGWHRIHKADNAFTVSVNVRQWNREIADPAGAAAWGRRAARYFALDPATGLFAPSKFCAFVPAPNEQAGQAAFSAVREPPGGMRMSLYSTLGEGDPRFDGNVARVHLERRLGYRAIGLPDASATLAAAFESWRRTVPAGVSIRSDAVLLVPRGR
jgi:hypothetical protein